MNTLFTTWRRSTRVGALTTLGFVIWWFMSSGALVQAQFTNNSEWPITDFDNTLVDLSEIMSGGPPKDGIPALDSPKFISTAKAGEWLDDKEPVIVVDVGGHARPTLSRF